MTKGSEEWWLSYQWNSAKCIVPEIFDEHGSTSCSNENRLFFFYDMLQTQIINLCVYQH